VAEYTKEVFRRIGEEYGLVIDTMEVEEDHVHIFLESLPKYSPARVAQILKSISAREIFHRFPWLRQQLWGGELWGDGYFVRSVGDQVTTDIIRRYINYQRDQAGQLKLWE
jgi:putative transposase